MHRNLKLIHEKIEMIESVVEERGGVTAALEDAKLARPAILMHLIAIAEQFQRLQDKLDYDTLSRFDKEGHLEKPPNFPLPTPARDFLKNP